MAIILIIDDNEGNADVLEYLFTEEGHKVTTVLDPTNIDQIVAELLPALILMDVHLGG